MDRVFAMSDRRSKISFGGLREQGVRGDTLASTVAVADGSVKLIRIGRGKGPTLAVAARPAPHARHATNRITISERQPHER